MSEDGITRSPGVYPGPKRDGRPTWFMSYDDVPDGWEFTCFMNYVNGSAWDTKGSHRYGTVMGQRLMLARRPRPNPSLAEVAVYGESGEYVVLVRDLVDRPDLHEFKYLTPIGQWYPLDEVPGLPLEERPGGLPFRVRRRRES